MTSYCFFVLRFLSCLLCSVCTLPEPCLFCDLDLASVTRPKNSQGIQLNVMVSCSNARCTSLHGRGYPTKKRLCCSCLLMVKVLTWTMAVWERGGKLVSIYECFITMFYQAFDHAQESKKVGERLMTIRQGHRNVGEYALEFHTLAAESAALKAVFCQGLNSSVLTKLHT